MPRAHTTAFAFVIEVSMTNAARVAKARYFMSCLLLASPAANFGRPRRGVGLHYLHAHQIATRAEEAAVRAAGVEWHAYDRFMQKYVKRIGDERLKKVPKDLDLKPYRDEQDDDLLRLMLKSVRADNAPKGIHVHDLAEAIQELRRRVRVHDTEGSQRAGAIKRMAK
jgi:hypothetical protein